jgi:hypothetical protein
MSEETTEESIVRLLVHAPFVSRAGPNRLTHFVFIFTRAMSGLALPPTYSQRALQMSAGRSRDHDVAPLLPVPVRPAPLQVPVSSALARPSTHSPLRNNNSPLTQRQPCEVNTRATGSGRAFGDVPATTSGHRSQVERLLALRAEVDASLRAIDAQLQNLGVVFSTQQQHVPTPTSHLMGESTSSGSGLVAPSVTSPSPIFVERALAQELRRDAAAIQRSSR